jgi:hypothetical protein
MIDWTDKALDAAVMAMGEGSYPRLSWGNRLKCREDFRKILNAAIEAQEANCEEFDVDEVTDEGDEEEDFELLIERPSATKLYSIEMTVEQIDAIIIQDLKDTYRLNVKFYEEEDECFARRKEEISDAILVVLDYYMAPEDYKKWLEEIDED